MNRFLSLCLVVFAIGASQGSVLRADGMMDMFQGLMSNPDAFASSIGMERVKRSNWDREFNLEKMGFNFKVKYQDPSNRRKGGVAEVYFKDFRKFVKGSPVKALKFVLTADSGAVFADGLFNFNIDYEFGFLFGGQDSGRVRYERKKNGAFYEGSFEFMSNSEGNPDRPPTVQVDLKSDYKTKATGRVFFDDHKKAKEYTWELDFINQETFKGVFKGEKTYSFEGKFNKGEKKVDLVVDLDGKKYNGFADVDFDGSQGLVKINFDLGPAGKFDFQFDAKKDMSEAGLKLFLNDKDILSAKLKGVLDQAPRLFKYEARYSGVVVGEGKVRVQYERFKELKFQYLPKTGQTFDLKADLNEDKTLNFLATATEDEVKNFEVQYKLTPLNDAATVGFNTKVDWFMKNRSPFYRFFYKMNCLHCLSSFKMQSNLAMQKNKLYKFDFDILKFGEDGSSHKVVDITTNNKYHAFFSEHFLNEMARMVNSYQKFYKDFEMDGEWNPGKFLKVTTNTELFQVFLIENMDGYMRKVEFNGKELMKAGFDKNGKQIKQTVELPNGKKVDTKLTWETDNFYNNKAKMTFDGPEDNKMETEFEWDMQPTTKNFKFDVKGECEDLGNYHVSRDYKYQYNNGEQNMVVKGLTNFPYSPLPENLETEMEAKYKNPTEFNFASYMVFAGEKFGWEYNKQQGFKWSF